MSRYKHPYYFVTPNKFIPLRCIAPQKMTNRNHINLTHLTSINLGSIRGGNEREGERYLGINLPRPTFSKSPNITKENRPLIAAVSYRRLMRHLDRKQKLRTLNKVGEPDEQA